MNVFKKITKRKLALFWVCLIWALLAFVSSRKHPVPEADAGDFWEVACGIETQSFDGYFPWFKEVGLAPARDGWHFYYYNEHHGRHLIKVDSLAVIAQINEVFKLLNKPITVSKHDFSHDFGLNEQLKRKNARRISCLDLKEKVNSDNQAFMAQINNTAARPNPAIYKDSHTLTGLDAQWQRSKRFWMAILFEALFLPLWWLFSFHGGVFGKYNRARTSRLALSPLLLFTPYFLGYAPYLFSFGETGGIVYPAFAVTVSLPFQWSGLNPVDVTVLNLLPNPLMHITQVPYSPMAVSRYAAVSPTVLIGFAILVLVVVRLYRKITKKPETK